MRVGQSYFQLIMILGKICTNYRRIRKGIQKKVRNTKFKGKLLAKYGQREKSHVEDRLKKITTLLAEIAREYNADLVREDLKDLNLNGRRKSKGYTEKEWDKDTSTTIQFWCGGWDLNPRRPTPAELPGILSQSAPVGLARGTPASSKINESYFLSFL